MWLQAAIVVVSGQRACSSDRVGFARLGVGESRRGRSERAPSASHALAGTAARQPNMPRGLLRPQGAAEVFRLGNLRCMCTKDDVAENLAEEDGAAPAAVASCAQVVEPR